MTDENRMPDDPVEKEIYLGLKESGIAFKNDPRETCALDFLLHEEGVYIEATAFHTPRKIEQCSRVKNIILIQGIEAARVFRKIISSRADLVAEKDRRIADLLEANNRYLERAREAEQALEKGELIVAYMAGFEQGKDEANRKDGE